MKVLRNLFLMIFITADLLSSTFIGDSDFQNGIWSYTLNWSDGVPAVSGDAANFDEHSADNVTPYMDFDVTLGVLNMASGFENPNNYSITFEDPSNTAQLLIYDGDYYGSVVNFPIILKSDLEIQLHLNDVALTNVISGPHDLIFTGPISFPIKNSYPDIEDVYVEPSSGISVAGNVFPNSTVYLRGGLIEVLSGSSLSTPLVFGGFGFIAGDIADFSELDLLKSGTALAIHGTNSLQVPVVLKGVDVNVIKPDATTATITRTLDLHVGEKTFDIQDVDGGLSIEGQIIGDGDLIKVGLGSLILSAQNSYSGATRVDSGTLQLTSSGKLPATTALTLSGGFFNMTNSNQTIDSLTFQGGSLVQGANGILSLTSTGDALTFDSLWGSVGITGEVHLTGATGGNVINASIHPVTISGKFDLGARARTFEVLTTLNMENVISGSGGIVKTGAGTLVFSAQNSYAGITRVDAGTLQLRASGTLPSTTALTISGGTIEFGGYNQTFDNLVFSSGTLVEGGAILILTGTGDAISISNDREIAGDVQLTGSTGGNVVKPDTLTAIISGTVNLGTVTRIFDIQNGSGRLNVENVISGSGGMIKTGPGTLNISSSANIYTGNTTVNEGTLQLTSSGGLPSTTVLTISGGTVDMGSQPQNIAGLIYSSGSILNPGTFTISGDGTAILMKDETITGDIILSGTGGTIAFNGTQGTAKISGAMNLGAASRIFSINKGSANVDMQIAGVLSNGSIDKQGAGKLELTANNTYTGQTLITEGVLAVNGSLANTAMTISSGATLQGSGTIGEGGATVHNSGNVSPGNSIDTITIDGTYTQNSEGTLTMELFSSTSHDQLIVNTGSVNLAGTLFLDYLPGQELHIGDNLVLIDNTLGTGVSGVFSAIVENNVHPAFSTTVFYDPNVVRLLIEEQTVPVESFAQSIFTLVNSPLIYIDRQMMNLKQQVLASVLHNKKAKENSYAFSIPQEVSGGPLTAELERAFQTYEKKSTKKAISPYRVYFGPIGSVGEVKTFKKQKGLNSWSAGALVGFDASYDYSAWGLTAAYEKLDAKVKLDWGSFDMQAIGLNSYGFWSPISHKHYFVEGVGGIGYQWQSVRRNSFISTAKSNPDSFSGNVTLGTGYFIVRENLSWVPRASLQYMGYSMGAYNERGAGIQNHSFKKQRGNSLRPTIALSVLGNEKKKKLMHLLPELHVRYQREVLDQDDVIHFSAATLPGDNTQSVFGVGKDFVFIGGSLQVKPRRNISFDGSYDFEWSHSSRTHYFYVGMNTCF